MQRLAHDLLAESKKKTQKRQKNWIDEYNIFFGTSLAVWSERKGLCIKHTMTPAEIINDFLSFCYGCYLLMIRMKS